MSGKPFRSFSNAVPIVGKMPSPAEMAADLARDMIDVIKEARAEAKAREMACEPSLPTSAAHLEAYRTLEALLKGRHRGVVLPILFDELPEMIAPATMTAEEAVALANPEGEA